MVGCSSPAVQTPAGRAKPFWKGGRAWRVSRTKVAQTRCARRCASVLACAQWGRAPSRWATHGLETRRARKMGAWMAPSRGSTCRRWSPCLFFFSLCLSPLLLPCRSAARAPAPLPPSFSSLCTCLPQVSCLKRARQQVPYYIDMETKDRAVAAQARDTRSQREGAARSAPSCCPPSSRTTQGMGLENGLSGLLA